MPLIKRSPFQTVKKPPKRRTASLPNISNLDETQYSLNDFKIDGGPVVLKLGAQELVFDNGQWNSSSATSVFRMKRTLMLHTHVTHEN